MHALDIVTYVAFGGVLVALPIFLVNWFLYMKKNLSDRSLHPAWLKAQFPTKSVVSFVGSIAVSMTAAEFSKHIAHADVLRELNALPSDCRVSVAGQRVDNPQTTLQVLRTLRWAAAHHSSPSHPIFVRVTTPTQDLVLNLSRDSSNPQEYWIFFPRYRVTSMNEIGRIFTDVFDAY
jgi:hypothetical protein